MIRAVKTHRELGIAAKPVLTCWLGEHSAEVLREAGYTDPQIAEMAQAGVTLLRG